MDEIISYKMCAVKVRNAKLRNYLNNELNPITVFPFGVDHQVLKCHMIQIETQLWSHHCLVC
jgi:hypothetical protein